MAYSTRQDCPDTESTEKQVRMLKSSCVGKKTSITKRIQNLRSLVGERGSRSKIKFLVAALLDVRQTLKEEFQKLSLLMENPNFDWIEEVGFDVDECVAEVQSYIDTRLCDSLSSESLTESWIRRHTPQTHSVHFANTPFEDEENSRNPTGRQPRSAGSGDHGFVSIGESYTAESLEGRSFGRPDTHMEASPAETNSLNTSGEIQSPVGIGTNGYQWPYEQPPTTRSHSGYEADNLAFVQSYLQPPSSLHHDMPWSASRESNHQADPLYSRSLPSIDRWQQVHANQVPMSQPFSGPYTTLTTISTNPASCVQQQNDIHAFGGPYTATSSSSGINHSRIPAFGGPCTATTSSFPGINHSRIPAFGDPCTATSFSSGIDHRRRIPALGDENIPESSMQGNNARQNLHQPPPLVRNNVDSWIDELDENRASQHNVQPVITADVTMSWMIRQSLPKINIPVFDGKPGLWIEFITKFKDLIHKQAYLNDSQRRMFLVQHLSGEPKRAVQGYADDERGYVRSLKRLKFLFGQRSRIAQAALSKITKGKQIQDDDVNALSEFYFTISDCLITLKSLDYASDMYSSDVLRQTVRRLPKRLHNKWAEHCLRFRQKNEEPTLVHLETWMQARMLALKDSYLPQRSKQSKVENKEDSSSQLIGSVQTDTFSCPCCKESHRLWRCNKFKEMAPSKRFDFVKRLKLCFNCFNANHITSNCTSRNKCFQSGCSAKHHTTLHEHFVRKKEENKSNEDMAKKSESKSHKESKETAKDDQELERNDPGKKNCNPSFNGMLSSQKRTVYLPIVPVRLIAPDGQFVCTYALLDSGSQSTLMVEGTAQALNLTGERKDINITTIKDNGESISVEEVSLDVASRDGNNQLKIKSAFVVPSSKFKVPSRILPSRVKDPDVYTHLDGIDLENIGAKDVTILIGANVPEALIPLEIRRGSDSQPLAMRTRFGWTLIGPSSEGFMQKYSFNMVSTMEDDEKMDEMLESFWKQEKCGTEADRDVGPSVEDNAAEDKLKALSYVVNGKYEVPMMRKDGEIDLWGRNFHQVAKRFTFLRKRLRTDGELHQKYRDTILQYIERGYARVMHEEATKKLTERTWYLPHHPVFKLDKMRMVFDCAAKHNGESLNDSLITGPDLLNSLVGVLLRFRTDPIAVVADIEAMYHQVLVSEEDADSLRFLWAFDIDSDEPPQVLQMMVHVFGAKDSSTCACYALRATARDLGQEFDPATYESIIRAFYMDDLLKSFRSEEIAVKIANELICMLKRRGFRLTKFVSNSKAVLESLPESEIRHTINFDLGGDNVERTLGVLWNIVDDVLTFDFNYTEAPYTKRGIVRTYSSIFDPLGFIGPFILKAKILTQELWRKGYGWDEEIGKEFKKHWESWLRGLKDVANVKLPRCYFKDAEGADVELHIFADASEVAYAAVAYLRLTTKTNDRKSILVMSKSKLAPIKTITLPRLELNAATLATRMYRQIIKEIDIPLEKAYFWTDSTLTLQYIRNDFHRFRVYVANRVSEIREVTEKFQWRHVPGEINPADIASRGVSDPKLLTAKNKGATSWTEGPEFLLLDDDEHPVQPIIPCLNENDTEVRTKSCLVGHCAVEENLINPSRFSQWKKLVCVVAWIMRFVANSRERVTEKRVLTGYLKPAERTNATKLIIRDVQREAFKDELKILQQGRELPKRSKISSLDPFVDEEGFVRVGGRLKHAGIPDGEKYQYILPKKSHVTRLIIRQEHEDNGHAGREHVLANTRQSYWIVNARAAIQNLIQHCECRVQAAKPKTPFMANLPKGRLAIGVPPFTHCGVDMFGPILVKQGRRRLKRWGIIFTCLTVRCLHLEVVENADTDSFINALRRFTNRRGKPQFMYSDCGTNFKGAARELKEAVASLDHKKIERFSADSLIKWKFNPPAAPHMGGIWERLVRSVKEVMSKLMKERVLTDSQLVTLFTEVERILNSRPLTQSSEDIDDLEALTPNHALVGYHGNWSSMGDFSESINSRKRWKQVQALANNFWHRWRREYLPILTTRMIGRTRFPNFAVGDLVIVKDGDAHNGSWPMGRITRVMPGDDDIVRVAEVKTKNGVYTRPTKKFVLLEESDLRQGEGDVGDVSHPSNNSINQ